jgi:hypothetical protein
MKKIGLTEYFLVNVGDFRETVLSAEASLDLAWDLSRVGDDYDEQFYARVADRYFGPEYEKDLTDILTTFFRLANPEGKLSNELVQTQYRWSIDMISNITDLWRLTGNLNNYWHELLTENLSMLEAACPQWEDIYEKSKAVESRLSGQAKQVFFDVVQFHVNTHTYVYEWNRMLHGVAHDLIAGDTEAAVAKLRNSKKILDDFQVTMNRDQWGPYKGFGTTYDVSRSRGGGRERFSPVGLRKLTDELIAVLEADSENTFSTFYEVPVREFGKERGKQHQIYSLSAPTSSDRIALCISLCQPKNQHYPQSISLNGQALKFRGEFRPSAHRVPDTLIFEIDADLLYENDNILELDFGGRTPADVYSVRIMKRR